MGSEAIALGDFLLITNGLETHSSALWGVGIGSGCCGERQSQDSERQTEAHANLLTTSNNRRICFVGAASDGCPAERRASCRMEHFPRVDCTSMVNRHTG